MYPIQEVSAGPHVMLTPRMDQGDPREPGNFQVELLSAGSFVEEPSLKPPSWLSANQHGLGFEKKSPLEEATAVQEAFREFIGKTVFGQMLKAMRKSVGKPAYFHGGQAEEIFRNQLDASLADEITKASASQWADPLFEHQFPHHAALLKQHEEGVEATGPGLADLAGLRRP